MSTFFQSFPGMRGKPVIQVEAGSWTMVARIGGTAELPSDGWRRDILVQGTVDGEPVATARYGGGNDFRQVKILIDVGDVFSAGSDERLLKRIAGAANAFVLPNISPVNHGTGPFPDLRGGLINVRYFLAHPGSAHIATSIATSLAATVQVEAVSGDRSIPIVITAGGAKDPYYGRLLATFTCHTVFAMNDRNGNPITETTSLGAAITGKAACLGIHPYLVDTGSLGISYRKVEPYEGEIARRLAGYRERWMEAVEAQRKKMRE
jgi:sugar (pentulose or hexulose) kinase